MYTVSLSLIIPQSLWQKGCPRQFQLGHIEWGYTGDAFRQKILSGDIIRIAL